MRSKKSLLDEIATEASEINSPVEDLDITLVDDPEVKERPPDVLVCTWFEDQSPGPPYDPHPKAVGLWMKWTGAFYTAYLVSPASKTYIQSLAMVFDLIRKAQEQAGKPT